MLNASFEVWVKFKNPIYAFPINENIDYMTLIYAVVILVEQESVCVDYNK